ncbi:DUF7310 family coiled-coil domain-containing protein [Haloarchaeobius amylolyticus]|uniref:DUF7310 family coiled-coil domain-containing protein n=1 Tax=Haloarchaeobius amylolyticus TaxID=1198296 RepID=UPI00226FD5DB|nr:hypothetical protein [Haloarchaeobius amylolyticus]
MSDQLDDRLRAVERAIADEDAVLDAVAGDGGATHTGFEAGATEPATGSAPEQPTLADRLDEVETAVADLEAAVQALRGYAGNVRSVNERVEQRADGAMAAVESLEERVAELEARSRTHESDVGEPAAGEWATSPGHSRDTDHDPYTIPDPDDGRDEPGLVARIREVL